MEITKSDIVKLIEEKQTDSFTTHLLTTLKWDCRPSGEIRNHEIRVWRQNGWNKIFYPIFKFDLNRDGHLINISDRINPVGRIIYFLFCVLFSIPWLHWVFEDFDISNHWIQFFGWVIFLGIFLLIGFKVYRMEKQIQLEQIYEILDIETDKKIEKEWSWTKILTRLIMYPLSIFLIIVNILFVIPKGQFILTIVSLGLVGIYLYTDLKILMRKKTTGNNG
ncbi:hypothetical protein [Maribacter polysaccharolyticus]|uniref:hypothetical protein n=1 Tax=Maribacter polysaccharolyticus TaxID=3020831 RepID=UPI00237F6420|nr:hypothetical protein [Maribacter polysaccharolyticus]MDE3744140.1 hypothetical protein [Maribacter polysaccharolyticus]